MICKVCEKGEIRTYKDGTTHCNNKNCLMDYTPAVYGRGSLHKRVSKPLWQIIMGDIFSFLVSPEGIKFMVLVGVSAFIFFCFGVMVTEAKLEGF